MWRGSLIAGAVASALAVAAAASAQAPRLQLPRFSQEKPNDFAWQLLAQHNLERDRKGARRLRWSQKLALQAQTWAEQLAREDRIHHADYAARGGAGENLWTGTAGYYGADDMIGAFIAEKKDCQPGAFPEVSRTGRWEDVGHYTQIIWPGTEDVGCAVAHNPANDFLVCRYWPAGNTIGVPIN